MERLQQTITELNDKLKNENKTPEELAKNLVKSALNAGAHDNVTAVVLAR